MARMQIRVLATRIGIAPSAIRYYEKAGLMSQPAREFGRRHYGEDAIGRLRIIRVAREAGFTIQETRMFLKGFSATARPAARWRSLADRKLAEFDVAIRRIEKMRVILKSSFCCSCLSIEDCERAIMSMG